MSMRLEGFEPPTRGLEGRRSSTELQARDLRVPLLSGAFGYANASTGHFRRTRGQSPPVLRTVTASGDLGSGSGAEVGGHDRDRPTPEGARRGGEATCPESDLAPLAGEDVRAVRRALHPLADGRLR
jgi:hypothetical protein